MTEAGNRTGDYQPLVAPQVRDVDPRDIARLNSADRRSDVPSPGAPLSDGAQPGESRTPADYGGGK